MHKIDGPHHDNNQFTAGTTATGGKATVVTATWLNAIQAELVQIIQNAGLPLDKANNNQVMTALSMLFAARKQPTGLRFGGDQESDHHGLFTNDNSGGLEFGSKNGSATESGYPLRIVFNRPAENSGDFSVKIERSEREVSVGDPVIWVSMAEVSANGVKAENLTGTINLDRLPPVPITKLENGNRFSHLFEQEVSLEGLDPDFYYPVFSPFFQWPDTFDQIQIFRSYWWNRTALSDSERHTAALHVHLEGHGSSHNGLIGGLHLKRFISNYDESFGGFHQRGYGSYNTATEPSSQSWRCWSVLLRGGLKYNFLSSREMVVEVARSKDYVLIETDDFQPFYSKAVHKNSVSIPPKTVNPYNSEISNQVLWEGDIGGGSTATLSSPFDEFKWLSFSWARDSIPVEIIDSFATKETLESSLINRYSIFSHGNETGQMRADSTTSIYVFNPPNFWRLKKIIGVK